MSSYAVSVMSSRLALGCIVLAALAACNRLGGEQTAAAEPPELAWARTALERNPHLQVLASDPQSRVFTVLNRGTGGIETVNINDLAAAPISHLRPQPSRPAAAPAQAGAPGPLLAQEEQSSEAAATDEPVEQGAAAAPKAGTPVEMKNYSIERRGDAVRVTGPGVSIVSAGRSSAASSPNVAGMRAAEPIICEGRRMLHLDDRNIYVDGDAVIARGGCELYITNSRIIASGTGLVVGDAIVHVANSHIEGGNGSFSADDRAKMFVRASTFQGVPRRAEFASVQDQGGNQWR